jgi:hypothetical protein
VDQEYNTCFTSLEGLVYPDFDLALTDDWPDPQGRRVGGIDFGWRNPFAAVWGVLDRDDVLWIGGERYLQQTPLREHAAALKQQKVGTWYADPAGRTDIEALRTAGLPVRASANPIRPGIAAVTARIRTGRLKVNGKCCPNLVDEAHRYRYPTPGERVLLGENPVDEYNHALGALRYLIVKLDARALGKSRHPTPPDPPASRPEPDNHWTHLS